MKKIISWIMTLTLLCAAIPLLNQSVAEAEEAPGKTYFVSLTGNDNGPGNDRSALCHVGEGPGYNPQFIGQ